MTEREVEYVSFTKLVNLVLLLHRRSDGIVKQDLYRTGFVGLHLAEAFIHCVILGKSISL